MTSTEAICLCGCGQSEHHVGKKGCKHCPGECVAFEPRPAPDGSSTSARLRQVEKERDEALADAEKQRGFWRECSRSRDSVIAERDKALGERDLAQSKLDSALLQMAERETAIQAERDGALVELRAQAERGDGYAAEVTRLNRLLEQAEQDARELLDNNGDTLAAMLDRATDAGGDALITAQKIRPLLDQLRAQLAEQDRRDALLTRREQLAAEIDAIDRELLGPEPTDKEIRAWAFTNGVHVNAGGQVSKAVREQYRAAHADPATTTEGRATDG
jgi:hypothetical protein